MLGAIVGEIDGRKRDEWKEMDEPTKQHHYDSRDYDDWDCDYDEYGGRYRKMNEAESTWFATIGL